MQITDNNTTQLVADAFKLQHVQGVAFYKNVGSPWGVVKVGDRFKARPLPLGDGHTDKAGTFPTVAAACAAFKLTGYRPKGAPPEVFIAYVQHGAGTAGPYQTEMVPNRYKPLPPGNVAKAGPIATHYELRTAGKWRRLYVSTGTPTHFVRIDRKIVPVTLTTAAKV